MTYANPRADQLVLDARKLADPAVAEAGTHCAKDLVGRMPDLDPAIIGAVLLFIANYIGNEAREYETRGGRPNAQLVDAACVFAVAGHTLYAPTRNPPLT